MRQSEGGGFKNSTWKPHPIPHSQRPTQAYPHSASMFFHSFLVPSTIITSLRFPIHTLQHKNSPIQKPTVLTESSQLPKIHSRKISLARNVHPSSYPPPSPFSPIWMHRLTTKHFQNPQRNSNTSLQQTGTSIDPSFLLYLSRTHTLVFFLSLMLSTFSFLVNFLLLNLCLRGFWQDAAEKGQIGGGGGGWGDDIIYGDSHSHE